MGPRIREQQLVQDDRYELQASTFVRWASAISNEQIKEISEIVKFKFLSTFSQLIAGETISPSGSRAEDIANALCLLDDGDRFAQISVPDLVDGNLKALCSTAWQFVQLFWKRFGPESVRDQKLAEVIKDWCLERTQKFDEVQINDFTSSWRDGYALNAILASYNVKTVVMDEVREMRGDERLEHAMGTAERLYNVPRLLLPKDFNSEYLDMKCVVCYLMMLYLAATSKKTKTWRRRSEPHPSESITKTDSQDSSHSAVAHALLEQKPSGSQFTVDSQPAASLESLRRHSQQSENMEARSRKSSSSSQRSGRKGRKAFEETVADYEICLEQVLAWLLEAEERANNMDPVEEQDVEMVKAQFRAHEHFMQSLTESQDSVGRVLHRGQVLCQKLDEKQSSAILSQLFMVNARWERVRENAMSRQNLLQQRLNLLQMEQLEAIRHWLDAMEDEMEQSPQLAPDVAATESLIRAHALVQEKIEQEQEAVKTLSNFVAVVDETDGRVSYEDLEKLLHSVGERWMAICEWAELRAHQLDEFFQLISQYRMVYKNLVSWLDEREEAMSKLRPVEELEDDAKVIEQVESLQQMEAALEAGHSDFVSLSQLAVDVLAKLDVSNVAAADQLRQEIDSITERWDNIVSRIEDHSQSLVKCGKAESRQLQRESSGVEREVVAKDYGQQREAETLDVAVEVNEPGETQRLTFVEENQNEQENSDFQGASASNVPCASVISPVEIFIKNLGRVSQELQPLIEWAQDFNVSTDSDDIRDVIQICQGKLREIKVKESQVNDLHSELERIRNLDVGVSQLQLANDSFEKFTLKWSQIVTKISDSLNSLSFRGDSSNDEGFDPETLRIAAQLDDFFNSSMDIVRNCAQIPAAEREVRLKKLLEQIVAQEKNVAFLEANLPDKKRVDGLKRRMEKVTAEINGLNEASQAVKQMENFFKSTVPPVGDTVGLRNELQQCETAISELKELKPKEGKRDQLERLAMARRDQIQSLITKTENCDQKLENADRVLVEFKQRFSDLKAEKLKLPLLIGNYQKLADDFQKGRAVLKEAEDAAKEMASVASYSKAQDREDFLEKLKIRVQASIAAWQSLDDDIQENISLLTKERKRAFQGCIRDCRKAVNELRQAITESREASDAEEFSENLDNLERLCHQVMTAAENATAECSSASALSDELADLKKTVEATVSDAKVRIDELNRAIEEWERFEIFLASFQQWQSSVQLTLSCRAADDVTAIDVPDEYKRLQTEFDHYESRIQSWRGIAEKDSASWGSSNRFQLQLGHITKQFDGLVAKFNKYRQPMSVDDKMERIVREVSEAEAGIEELTEVAAESCANVLDHVKQVALQITKIKIDLHELNDSKALLLQDRILTASAGEELDKRIAEQMKKLGFLGEKRADLPVTPVLLSERCDRVTVAGANAPGIERLFLGALLQGLTEGNMQRSSEMIERFDKGVALTNRLQQNLKSFDDVLNDVESKLNAFTQSESMDNTDLDRTTLEALQNELNRNEASLSSAEEIAGALRKESIKCNDDLIERRWRRVRRIHGDLRSWIDAIKSMAEDGISTLAQYDTTYSNFIKILEDLEKIHVPQILAVELDKNRSEKSLLLERYRRLVKANADVESKFCFPLCQMEERWNNLEKKCQKARSSPCPARTPEPLPSVSIDGTFQQQIRSLHKIFGTAKDFINFEKYPVVSVSEWAKRIQEVNQWLLEYGDQMKSVLEEGRRLASSGRMELDVHDALESLDDVVELANQVESAVKSNTASLLPLQAKAEALSREMRVMKEVLDQLAARDLSEPTIANATQRDLLDRQAQLEQLHRKSEDLHRCLPGASSDLANKEMDEIYDQVRFIEDEIGRSMKKKASEKELLSGYASSGPSFEDRSVGPDTVSVSSAGGPSLALEVQETDDERIRRDSLKSSFAPPTIKIETADSMATAYIEMDKIEDFLAADDPFPFESVPEKEAALKSMSKIMDRVDKTVKESQMTMDLMEGEAAMERVLALRSALARRQKEVNRMVDVWKELDTNLKTSDDMLHKINVVLADVEGRNRSPDLEELESIAVVLGDRLQQAYAQIQHTSLKAEPVVSQMGEKQANIIESSLRRLGELWKQCESRVNDKRRSLDERLADRSDLINEIELLEFWCDETETECSSTVNVLNVDAAYEFSSRIAERISEYDEKSESLRRIELLKERFVSSNLADPSVKHRMQCIVAELGKRLKNLKDEMEKRKATLDKVVEDAKAFQSDVAVVLKFCERAERAVQIVEDTKLVVPSGADLDYVRTKQPHMESLVASVERRWKNTVAKDSSIDEHQNFVVDDLLRKWAYAKERIASVAHVPTLVQDSSSTKSIAPEENISESRISTQSAPEEPSEKAFTEYGSLKESAESEEGARKALSQKEQALLNTVVQLRHWLSEAERGAAVTVDIINLQAIRDAAHQVQSFVDQMKIRHLELLRVLNESNHHSVQEKTELTLGDWDRVLSECKRRKSTLNKMISESRAWEQVKCAVQLWLTEAQQRLNEGSKASELNEEGLRSELSELKEMDKKFDEMKDKMAELNTRSNALLDTYRIDEGHNLSHATSRINNFWTKFNDNLRIRRAVLEAALRSRNDFQSALTQLEQWMNNVQASLVQLNESAGNTQLLKDSFKRREWIDTEKCFQLEMDAHEDLVHSVGEMGTQLVRSAEDSTEREGLIERLNGVNGTWREMRKLDGSIRQRLVDAQEEWERLISQLSENLFWVESRHKVLLGEQPVGSTLVRVQQQNDFVKKLEQEMEKRQREVDDCVTLAHSYLMQHDLRPKMHSMNALSDTSQPSDDEKAELRRVGLQINTDCEDLVKKWAAFKKQVHAWSRVVDDAHAKMEQLSSAVAECQLALSNVESTMEKLTPVEQLRLDQLVDAMKDSEMLKEVLARTRIHIDDANDWCGQLLASNIVLDAEPSTLLKSVNDRFAKLKVDVRIRIAALEHALADFGPCSQHFLMNSVRPPWQRAISAGNHLPYYINHETEMTQWDHPAMVEILAQLSKFNQVKFSAYRTGMKVRAIQKRLCLDLLSLQELDAQLRSLNTSGNDQLLPIRDAVMCLVPLYESAHNKFPHLVRSVPLAVDLFLNFVLDVYDPGRDGILRTFSFKVALVSLCRANLEDKYKYLYQLVSTNEGVDQKGLALLLYDTIYIPKFFGEAAAFGGSNVEPSVRSCFETVKFNRTINIDEFLVWLKKEPQTIVWLPVMHRLASAEFAKHQAKCNVCKMYPITGLRYRCLRCFNFDMCQNCFFSQRIAKNHKLSHPMQEYCIPTTSGEDVRDFGLIVRNKFRSSSKSRIGYLPVQTVDEGVPLEMNNVTPTNPSTEHLHNRMQICAQRLWRSNGDTPPPPLPDNVEEPTVTEVKSPLQLLSQVEQMHKEELHQVLHKLQSENRELKKEIERRKNFDGVGSTPNLTHSLPRNIPTSIASGRSVPSLPHSTDEHLMREARLLRQHKDRLEERSRILEEQNRQLEVQLARLRTVISKQQSTGVEEPKMNGGEREMSVLSGEEDEGIEYDTRPNRMPSLIASVDQLGRAMQSLVVSMVNGEEDNEEEAVKHSLDAQNEE